MESVTKNEAPSIMIDRDLLRDLIADTKQDGSTEALLYFFQIFDLLSEAAELCVAPVIEDRALRTDFRGFWRVALQGFSGFIVNRATASYGGFKSAETKRIMKEKGISKDEAEKTIIPFAEWWAKQPEYTEEVGKNQPWYQEAKAIHDSTHFNPVKPPLTVSTNRKESTILDIESTVMYDSAIGGGVDPEGDRGNPIRGEPYVTIRNELNRMRSAIVGCIENSNTAALGAIMKRYGLNTECVGSFLHTIELDSDPLEQMAQFIEENGGRLPPGS